MKNRIWKQIRRTSIAAAAAGTVLVGNIQPGTVLASAFQSGPNPKVEQSCFWTDREKGMAELDIRITGLKDWIMERRISDGNENLPEITESENKQEMEEEDEYMEELASGKTVYEENETQEEESEGSQEGTTSGGEDVENESSVLTLENEEVTEAAEQDESGPEEDQNPEETEEEESEEKSGENGNPDVEPEPVTCVVYVSEYFSPETTSLPENVQTQQIPVKNQKGEDTEITKLVYKIETENFHEESILLQIPMSLREEYRYPVEEASYLLVQDEPLQKDCGGAGTVLLVEENGSTQTLAEGISPILTVKAARADMTLSVTSETEEMKAGKTIRYRVDLANTGALDLEDIRMTSSFSCPKITQQWEEAQGLTGKGSSAEVTELKAGEQRSFYILAPLLNEQEKDLEHKVEAGAKVKGRPEKTIFRKAEAVSPLQPLKADFSVKKTADRESAAPGENVMYQICIINTGEKTLHSVVGTERFQAEGIEAQFVEQEGITLNSTRTKALIPQIAPGEAVSLQAKVKIPEKTVNQKLFNQISVTSKETGEKQVTASAEITVEGKTTQASEAEMISENGEPDSTSVQEGMTREASTHPKTGDDTDTELLVLLALTAAITALGAFWLHRKYAGMREKK
ncbi:DUF7507 domain-containing protein [Lachnospiraceae bacterium]|uniref:COG1470 family protein n=1 Tax=Blautia luti TaxID=89014 RepID=UPI0015A5B29D